MASYYYALTVKSNAPLDQDDIETVLSVNFDTEVKVLEFDLEDDEYADV